MTRAQQERQAQQERRAEQERQPERPTTATAPPPPATATTGPAPAARPRFADLDQAQQREVADLYRRGLQAVRENRPQDAVRFFELVWNRAPDYMSVAENLKREYLVQGMDAFAAGQLDRSIEAWEKADMVVPGDPRTRGYLTRAYEHKSRIQKIRGEN